MSFGSYPALADTALDDIYHVHGAAATHYDQGEVPHTATACTVVFQFFVGALDNRENAIIRVRISDIALVETGNYFILDGDTERWNVNDVRDIPGQFECRVIKTKPRG